MKLYIVNFRKCPSTVLSLVVNPILLIKMSAFTGDSIHIDQIYVHICMLKLYIKVLFLRIDRRIFKEKLSQ